MLSDRGKAGLHLVIWHCPRDTVSVVSSVGSLSYEKENYVYLLKVGSNFFDQSRSSVIHVCDSYFTNKLSGNENLV